MQIRLDLDHGTYGTQNPRATSGRWKPRHIDPICGRGESGGLGAAAEPNDSSRSRSPPRVKSPRPQLLALALDSSAHTLMIDTEIWLVWLREQTIWKVIPVTRDF